jgi:hypothetical protein
MLGKRIKSRPLRYGISESGASRNEREEAGESVFRSGRGISNEQRNEAIYLRGSLRGGNLEEIGR